MVLMITIMASIDDMDLNRARKEKEEESAAGGDDDDDDEIYEEDEYVVEAIRDWRYNLSEKRREYLIKWKGYEEIENTWEPEDHLHCPDILEKYINSLDSKRHRHWSSETPGNLSGFQRNATFQGCIGADGPHDSDSEESDKKNKQKFYCLILFEDSEFAEEVTLKEFMQHRPQEAWNFLESRMYFK